jgi:two-component system, OmpR family, phosphate regulon sensor histidine kinase PhoR
VIPLPRLFWRLFLSYAISLAILLVSVAWYLHASAHSTWEQTQAIALRSAALSAISSWEANNLPLTSAALQPNLRELGRATGLRYCLVDRNGRMIGDSEVDLEKLDTQTERSEFSQVLLGKSPWQYRQERFAGGLQLLVIVPWKSTASNSTDTILGALRVSTPVPGIIGSGSLNPWLMLLAFGGVFLGVGWIVLRRICRPLELLSETIRHHEHSPSRLGPQSTLELSDLSEAFHRLHEQLEERSHTIGRKGTEQQAVLASMAEGVLAVDSEQRVITLNRAAADLIGIAVEEAAGKNLQSVLRNADLRRFVLRALESLDSIEDDITLLGERPKVLQARGTALRDSRGRAIGAVIVLNDVTHTRHLENIRRDFVANVSHELKTPIASIKGFVETLLDGAVHEPADAERFLRIVVKQADRLNTIIEDLLSLSKIEQSEEAGDLPLEYFPIRDVLESVLTDCENKANERQITLELNCQDPQATAINPRLLEQAVANLVDNALKYSEPGSRIEIYASSNEREVVIAVRDHGCGIEREHLPRLFERFYRVDRARSRKLGGTGLGLAIVKHIVQAHRGRIDVESTPGQGSTFRIHLPRVTEPQAVEAT